TSIAEIKKNDPRVASGKRFSEIRRRESSARGGALYPLTQMASASVKIISDTVAGWREVGHPLRNDLRSPQFDLTASSAEDNSTSTHVQEHHQPQSHRPVRTRIRGKRPPERASGEEQ